MLIVAHKDQKFVAVSILTKMVDGNLVSPDADPLCEIFRMDPTTGLLAKDLSMGNLGEIFLSLVPGSSFLFSGALDLTPAAFSDYALTISYSYGGGVNTNIENASLLVSIPDTVTFRSRLTSTWSQGTTFTAPTKAI